MLPQSNAALINKYDQQLAVYYSPDTNVTNQLQHILQSTRNNRIYSIGRSGEIAIQAFALERNGLTPINNQVSAIHTFIRSSQNEDGSYTIIEGKPSRNGTQIMQNAKIRQATNELQNVEAGTSIILPYNKSLSSHPVNGVTPSDFRFILPRDQADVDHSPQRFRHVAQAILDMPENSVKIIGRNDSADIVISNRDNLNVEISRLHATVQREKNDPLGNRVYRFSDGIPASRNGTAVMQGGTWKEVKGEQKVWPGDELRLGNELYFTIPHPTRNPAIAAQPRPSHGVIDVRSFEHQQRVAGRADYAQPSMSSPNGRLNNWRILGRDRAFDQGVYLGGGTRPAIVIDKSRDLALREFTNEFIARAKKTGAINDEATLLEAAYDYVGSKIRNDGKADERVMNRYNLARDEEVLLGAYIDNKGGVCAHKSLILGSLLESLKDQGHLRGAISFERNQVVGLGAHAWIRYTTADGRIIISDPTQYRFGELRTLDSDRWVYERVNEL